MLLYGTYIIFIVFIFINPNAFAYNVLCTVLLLDDADIRQHLGFEDHQHDLGFSGDEDIGGGK
jgi:hypothetical protein